MTKNVYQPILAVSVYLLVSFITTLVIQPFSVVILLGAAAGTASGILILWGIRQLIFIILAKTLFDGILYFYFNVVFDLSVFIISLLAICAQAVWAKALTDKYTVKGQWIDSRKKLSFFIYRVGPLASIVSAMTSILITVISAKSFDVNLLYVFCQTWSMSILIAIFGIPILLFLNAEQQFNRSKQLFVVAASIFGALVIALLFKIGHDRNQQSRNDEFLKVQTNITVKLEQQMMQIEQQVKALKAFFEASNEVSIDSFNEFSAYMLDEQSQIESFEWAPVIHDKQRSVYENHMSEVLDTHYMISQQTIMGNNIKSAIAPLYFPVQYVFPRYQNEQILGVDLFEHSDKKQAIQYAIKTGKLVSTLPLNMIEGNFSEPVILIVAPIYNQSLNPSFGYYNYEGALPVSGVVVAVVKLSVLFKNTVELIDNEKINLFINDVNNNEFITVFGQKLNMGSRLSITGNINFFSRVWNYQFAEKNIWGLQDKSWQTWGVLIGGTLGGVVFQILILMMAAYSSELSSRVTQKTRELILSKEKSDNENQAKTDFLQSLSIELRVPLNVVKRLVEVFPKKNLSELEKDYIDNISSAAINLEQLIDTLNELSSIESGRLFINTQSFDFILFLKRMEDVLVTQTKNIKFIIQEDVPQFIETDELRLQQVFITCAENAKEILANNNICISVKVHFHHQNNATIVFVFHVIKTNELFEQPTKISTDKKEHFKFNLRMEMAKELCNKLGGNINIAELPSGESMIHVSVKVKVSQEQELGFEHLNIPEIENIDVLDVKRVLYVEGNNRDNKNLYRQLLSLKYYVDVISFTDDLERQLFEKKYHVIIFDCCEAEMDIETIPTPLKGQFSNITTLAMFNHTLENDMLSLVNHKFTAYVVLPITTENLRGLISSYLK